MEAAVGVDRFADLSLEEMEQQWINVKGLESI
jgi:AMMECR1 domain-containing protein